MEAVFLKCLNLSIRASYMILAVLLIRILFSSAPKKYFVWLWAAVFIRLVFPFAFSWGFSLLPQGDVIPADITVSKTPAIDSGIRALDHAVNPLLVQNFSPSPEASVNPMQVLAAVSCAVWITGMALMLGYLLVSSFMLRREISRVSAGTQGILQSNAFDTPFVFGIFRPVICLPGELEEEKKHYILLHEQMHLERKDHILKPAAFMILSVYWFHPLVWLTYILLCRDIETACDEAVIGSMNRDEQSFYAETLLKCAAGQKMPASPVAFGETNVKKRIRSILNYRKPSVWIGTALVLICIALCAGFFTDPENKDVPSQSPVAEPSKPEELVLTVEAEQIEYTCTDSEIYIMFENMFDQLMTMQTDPQISRPADAIENINDVTITYAGKSLGYMYSSFRGLVSDDAFVEGYYVELHQGNKARYLLLKSGSETAEKIKNLENTIINNGTSSELVYNPESDEWVKAWLEQLGKPDEYIFPENSIQGFHNEETWNAFLEKCENGIPATVTIADYTVEGDLIYTYLYYDLEGYYYAMDTSRDRFGGDETFWSDYYKYLSVEERDLEEDGRYFHEIIAVVSDMDFDSYEEIKRSLENGDALQIVFERTDLMQ